MESAYPVAFTGPVWKSLSKESITKFQTRGERIPPCVLPLPGLIFCVYHEVSPLVLYHDFYKQVIVISMKTLQ